MLEQEILDELRLLNQNIKKKNSLASAIATSFLNGLVYSLGSLFGTAVIAGVFLYMFTQFSGRLIAPTTDFIEKIMQNIKWDKVLPKPKMFELPQSFDFNKIQDSISQ